jgi:CheY-like chemotaxis protein
MTSVVAKAAPKQPVHDRARALEVLHVFLRLGLTSFGGPIAHLGYFREEFVARRKWVDDASFVDLVALSQFLPGPASSQVGFALGLGRAGWAGGPRGGAEVRAAASADEGLSALEEWRPDVLLSDLAMPVRDGFGLIAQVRSLPADKGGRIPAAALSALVGVDDRQRALAAGFQLHVPKPVDADGLLSAVARLAATRQR